MLSYSMAKVNAPIILKSYDSPTPRGRYNQRSLIGIRYADKLPCCDWGRNEALPRQTCHQDVVIWTIFRRVSCPFFHYLTRRITRVLCSSMSSDSTFFCRTFGIWNLLCPSSSCESTIFRVYEVGDLRLLLVVWKIEDLSCSNSSSSFPLDLEMILLTSGYCRKPLVCFSWSSA